MHVSVVAIAFISSINDMYRDVSITVPTVSKACISFMNSMYQFYQYMYQLYQ